MKLYLYLFSLAILSFASCVNNDDDNTNTGGGVEPIKPLTVDNLEGTWQNYYFKKKLDNKYETRVTDFDGATITFFKNETYFETNAQGKKTLQGTYKIANDQKTVNFFFKSPSTQKDSTETRPITEFTAKRFVINKTFVLNKRMVSEVTFWRNMATMPDLYPNAPKMRLIPEKLLGKWQIKSHKETLDGPLNDVTDPNKSPVGNTLQYFADKTYTEILKEGAPASQGTYKIVDDVVHSFANYDMSGEDKKGHSSSLQIKEWTTVTVNGAKVEQIKVYESFYYYDKEGVMRNLETTQLLQRVP